MPRVERKNSLLDYYIQSYRSANAPHVDYRDLCSVAASLATALGELNGRGYVVGDINESNACITDNQHVTLIDADSFQVLDHDITPPEVYRCTVGKPEYTPPELQGMSFEEVERTIHHDRFALAVVIYQLLMEGRHPFSGVYSGGGEEPNYEDSISEGYFLYSRSRGVPLASLPRDHILWEALDERLRDLLSGASMRDIPTRKGVRRPGSGPLPWRRPQGRSASATQTPTTFTLLGRPSCRHVPGANERH